MTEFIKPDFSNKTINKKLPTISITRILDLLKEPFDKDGIAEKTYKKHFNDPTSEYYNKTKKEIINEWNQRGAKSMKYGSLLDDYIGICLTKTADDINLYKINHNYDYDSRIKGLCNSFDNFYSVLSKSGDTVFVDREKTLYYKIILDDQQEYNIKGRFDALFYNKRTNKWIVIDWKSSGTVETKKTVWTKNLLGPMDSYPELNWYTYTTQLYFYKKALVDTGYLPAGTDYSDIIVMIVNLPGKEIPEYGRDWMIYNAAYPFDSDLMDRVFRFGIQKDNLIKKMNKSNQPADDEEELNKTNIDTLEMIF